MKNLLFPFFVSLTTMAFAQTSENSQNTLPRGIIKISPLQFLSQTLELSVEALNADYTKSFQFSGSLRSGHYDYEEGGGAGVTLAYRKYVKALNTPTKRDPDASQGIYYSLFLKADYFRGEDAYYWSSTGTGIDETITTIDPGFTIGWQRTIFDVLFLDVYVGGGIKIASINTTGGVRDSDPYDFDLLHPGYDGIHPVVGVKLGVGL
jgi:hypothetical protein